MAPSIKGYFEKNALLQDMSISVLAAFESIIISQNIYYESHDMSFQIPFSVYFHGLLDTYTNSSIFLSKKYKNLLAILNAQNATSGSTFPP